MGELSNDKKAIKSGLWYIISNFAVKGMVFFTTPIFTRLMSASDIGYFSNVSAWVAILSMVTSLELMASVTFAKFEYGEKSLDEFISSVLVLSAIVSLGFYAVVLIFRDSFMNLFHVDFLSLNLMFLYCLVSPALQMIQVKNRVLFQYKASAALSLASVFVSTVSALILVLVLQNKLAGRMIGHYGALILFNFVLFIFILLRGRTVNPGYWKFALGISLPMVIHGLSGQLLSSCDRIMITSICGSDQNALYSIAYTGAMVISVLWTSLNTAWSPWAYDQMDRENYSKLKKASRPYITMFFFIVLVFMLLAPELMLLMGGKSYLEAVNVIPPVVAGMFFQFVYSIYVNIEFFHKKQKYTAMGTAAAAVTNVVLNWLFIPKFGYIAAAYTTLIGYVMLFSIHFFIVVRMKKAWWYDTKFNLSILSIMLLLIFPATLLYRAPALRWCILGVGLLAGLAFLLKRRRHFLDAMSEKSLEKILQAFSIHKG